MSQKVKPPKVPSSEITTPEFWTHISALLAPISRGVDHLVDKSHQPRPYVETFWTDHLSRCRQMKSDAALREHWIKAREIAWAIASSNFESEELHRLVSPEGCTTQDYFEYFGFRKGEGNGRRLRMELLSMLWLISYFYGVRDDIIKSSMFRIGTITRCVPLGLSYWVYAGAFLDAERFRFASNMSRGDVYVARKKFPEIKDKVGTTASEKLMQDCLDMGLAYARLQIFLTAATLKAHQEKYQKTTKLWLVTLRSSPPFTIEQDLQDVLAVVFDDNEEVLKEGGGVFGCSSGVTTFGTDDSLYWAQSEGPAYNGFVVEADSLFGRRKAIKYLIDKPPTAKPTRIYPFG